VHNGALYPISGEGFFQLSRPAYKVLQLLKSMGNTSKAMEIIRRIG
jgi:hypothetical protein